ncbi:MAG: GNAT family N-acetyltransferase, partial [Bacteroidota bacterium]
NSSCHGMLSDQSLYTRFFSGSKPPEKALTRWLESIDQEKHVSWGALHASRPEIPGVGIMHLIQLPQRPGVAEIAITVIDAYQRHGLGTYFLALLYALCPSLGIHTLIADVLESNQAVIQLVLALGGKITHANKGGVALELSMQTDWDALPQTSVLVSFQEKTAILQESL